ncbi:Rieske (2Fe-2S) protein [Streptomyces sp. 549]|uniref:Rieske (2Fe-2S) protein n=1 Tax=Streptomyces sp. 549 TaxID=3049076 RepID=UPI0024C276C4|nr:Rieske (2Fe-2S) protein [Streptomyces sp. 549]MDK1474479.1 Rieske (2Fe-2S) protein [Streptomyces sp. 549]
MSEPVTTRRTLLAAAGAAGLAASLAACGDGGSNDPAGGGTDTDVPPADQTTGGQQDGGQPAEGGGSELAKTADIPEGGGTVFKDQKVVVTQPTSGEYKAYSAVCTHQNCLVAEVSDGTINCACHGSKFSITDGSVTAGPAQQALPAANISVEGDAIRMS